MTEQKQPQDLGVNHHQVYAKGDISGLETAVEEAKKALEGHKDVHEKLVLTLKQQAAEAIKKIKDELVQAERAEEESYKSKVEELSENIVKAKANLAKGQRDDLAAAEKKAAREAGALGYQSIRFNGETPTSWSFVFTDKVQPSDK